MNGQPAVKTHKCYLQTFRVKNEKHQVPKITSVLTRATSILPWASSIDDVCNYKQVSTWLALYMPTRTLDIHVDRL